MKATMPMSVDVRPGKHEVARVAAAQKRARVGIEEHAIERERRAVPGIEIRANRVVGAVLKNQRVNLCVGKRRSIDSTVDASGRSCVPGWPG
jgi:hypothetical protein